MKHRPLGISGAFCNGPAAEACRTPGNEDAVVPMPRIPPKLAYLCGIIVSRAPTAPISTEEMSSVPGAKERALRPM